MAAGRLGGGRLESFSLGGGAVMTLFLKKMAAGELSSVAMASSPLTSVFETRVNQGSASIKCPSKFNIGQFEFVFAAKAAVKTFLRSVDSKPLFRVRDLYTNPSFFGKISGTFPSSLQPSPRVLWGCS